VRADERRQRDREQRQRAGHAGDAELFGQRTDRARAGVQEAFELRLQAGEREAAEAARST